MQTQAPTRTFSLRFKKLFFHVSPCDVNFFATIEISGEELYLAFLHLFILERNVCPH